MHSKELLRFAWGLVVLTMLVMGGCKGGDNGSAPLTAEEQIKRGEYLTTVLGGCGDCHSPKIFGPQGPQEEISIRFSGHPAGQLLPEVPAGVLGPDKWGVIGTNDMTAWVGPWGISFAANLTPDQITGSGAWTEAAFIKAMRTGKHLGAGRDILPPMPWPSLGKATDEDLKAILAYLKSLPPIPNMVPQPIPPAGQ